MEGATPELLREERELGLSLCLQMLPSQSEKRGLKSCTFHIADARALSQTGMTCVFRTSTLVIFSCVTSEPICIVILCEYI